jgi:hypothetical protein
MSGANTLRLEPEGVSVRARHLISTPETLHEDSPALLSWKRRKQPRINLTNAELVLYSTHFSFTLARVWASLQFVGFQYFDSLL